VQGDKAYVPQKAAAVQAIQDPAMFFVLFDFRLQCC
jgi:hypothetical protein